MEQGAPERKSHTRHMHNGTRGVDEAVATKLKDPENVEAPAGKENKEEYNRSMTFLWNVFQQANSNQFRGGVHRSLF